MTLKGRHWVILWLGLFLGVAAVVVARQTGAYQAATRIRKLREERGSLEARRADLQRRIRDASSRQILGRKAEALLGLHQPSDSEFTVFPVPASVERDRP